MIKSLAVSAALLIGAAGLSTAAQAADQAHPANPYHQAEMTMHQRMMKATDSNASRTFATKMIEHHRGGIAMSEILLQHSQDAELRRMAQKTIEMQKKEVGELEDWLKRHPK